MITWFDALLITLLALATALGARRGLAGLVWGVGCLVAIFAVNLLALGAIGSGLLTLVLVVVISLAIRRLIPQPLEKPWHLVLGGVGGLLIGAVLISSLALSFPLAYRASPTGKQSLYPSPDLNPGLYEAVANSALQTGLRQVWTGNQSLRLLLIPDQVK